MLYSQNAEQVVILQYFADKPRGKFMDIGAFDVFKFSNTRALFEKGWAGLLIEPAPVQFGKIQEHYKDEPRIQVFNVAIGTSSEPLEFYLSEDAVSTSDVPHMTKWANAGVKFEKTTVPQVHVADFMKEHCVDIDMISLDTEATNMKIFREIPDFVFDQISLFVVEHDTLHEEVEDRLASFGFYPMYLNGENIILGK